MPAGSRAALILVLALVLPAGAVLAGSPGDAGPAQVSSPQTNASTNIVVQIQPDGDAEWTISTSLNLTSDNETAAFRELASEFENGQTSALGLEAYRQANEQASRATGREMAIENKERTASPESVIENGTGRLVLSFTWTNFGRVEGDRIHVDDVYETPEGTWLPGLEPDQTLVVRAPDQYSVFDANVAPENGTLRWTGPASFGPDTLDATFTGGSSSTPTPSQPLGGGLVVWFLVGIAGIAGGSLAVYFITRRDGDIHTLPSPFPPRDEKNATEAGAEESSGEPPQPQGEEETSDTPPVESGEEATEISPAGAEEESQEGATEKPQAEESVELLSDEERVERLLRENGGRMKQANIVKETDWSNAKVSQLLSSMEDEGRIDKLRIGRENLISFPDEDITEFED